MNAFADHRRSESLSAAQRQIWQACQDDPASPAHTVLHCIEISGPLDLGRLREAARRLTERHPELSDCFATDADGMAYRRVVGSDVGLTVIDAASEDLPRLVEIERHRLFDLAAQPLFHVKLLCLGAEHNVLVLCAHRLLLGRAELIALGGELASLYSGVIQAPDMRRMSAPASCARVVDHKTAIAFWRAQLAGAEPLLAFPTDLPRPPRIVGTSAILTLPLSAGLTDRLRRYCVVNAVCNEELLLAAFQVLLFRYSDQSNSVLGVPASAGADAESVPLVQKLDAAMSFKALLLANRRRQAQLSEPAALVFSAVMDRLLEVTAPSHAPVFQHRFSYLHADAATVVFDMLSAAPIADPEPIGQLDTSMAVIETGARLTVCLRYNTGLYEAATVERWGRNFLTLLESICANDTTAIGSLTLLHLGERHLIQSCLDHDDGSFHPRYSSISAAVEQQVAKTPGAIALRCGQECLTYAQLDRRANAIARHLGVHGVGVGDLVGLCTARTPDMIAAVLGILKLGAAYVPMDLAYPVKRLEAIASEAKLTLLLCDGSGGGVLRVSGLREIDLADIAADAEALPPALVDDETLCHVIFTSGSTGKPKGVMTRHRNVLAFMEWLWATFSAADLGAVLCGSSLCFDMTVFEIWGPLTTGGTVVLVDNAASLMQRPETRLTLVTTVPTAIRLLVDERAMPADIRVVITCGERLDAQLVEDVFRAAPKVKFFNTYGPTEDTVFSTCYRVQGPDRLDPPIGIPIVHEFGKIVDAAGEQVPVGAVGELLLGGAGVAKGYLYNPEQTMERFQTATDYAGRSANIYRTGDFVRLGNDGQIHFVGRKDDQIKLRGFRIDLGDVVAALGLIPGILDARVLLQSHPAGPVLVAYVSHADAIPGMYHDSIIVARIEREARSRLPAYMVPAYFVLFDKLPLNENGKVDCHKLRAISFDVRASAVAVLPMSGDEQAIADIWQAVLGVDGIGPGDDFFQLGGNSLQAVRMTARLNKKFSGGLSSQVVFEDRTVARLATRLRQEAEAFSPALHPVDLSAGVMPTFPQLAMLMDSNKASFNMCSAMHIKGPLNEAALRRALMALVRRHHALSAIFAFDGMDVSMNFSVAVPDILRVVAVQDKDIAAQAAAERRRPFSLHAAAPARALLLRLAPDRHIFILSIHHVVTDEWSINVIKRDLAALYAAELSQDPAALPELPIRYGDFVHWQGVMHRTAAYERQIGYWAGELAAICVHGDFPATGGGDGPITAFRRVRPPAESAARLRVAAARHGYTRYVLLLSALHQALAAYSGLAQQVVWSPIARRVDADLEESVGLYTNLSVIAVTASASQTLGQFLEAINTKVAQARLSGDVSALTAIMRNPALLPQSPMIGFNFIELPKERSWCFSGTEVAPFELRIEEEADLCVLELTARVGGDAIDIDLAYNTRLFDAAAIDRIVAGLWAMMDSYADDLDRPLPTAGRLIVPTEMV